LGLIKIVFVGFLLTICSYCFAQNEEKVIIHTHRSDFIVGEKIYFSASVHDLVNNTFSKTSSILYIDIRSSNGLSIDNLRFGIVDGMAHGEIFLDNKFDSDYYYLIAYTKWQKNFKAYSTKPITIINPYKKRNFEVDSGSTVVIPQPKFSYKRSSNHSITIPNIKDGNYSIAIVKAYGSDELPEVQYFSQKNQSLDYYPETNYATLQGKLLGEKIGNQQVSLSFQSSDMQLSLTETDQNGDFLFYYNPDKVKGVGKIHSNEKSIQIVLDDDFQKDITLEETPELSLDKKYFEAIQPRALNNQIMDAYFEPESLEVKQNENFLPFNTIVYKLDDYKRFSSVRTPLIEVICEVAASKNPDNFELSVRSGETDSFIDEGSADPLILLDGIITDSKTVLEYPANQLEKIEILPYSYFFGPIRFDGIISFHSKEKYVDKTFENAIVPSKYQPFKPNYVKKVPLNDSRKPQLENTLYWEPFREVDDQALEIDFATGTDSGLFKVSIMSHSEKGKEVYSRYFLVD